MRVSIFGPTGYIASAFRKQTQFECIPIERESREPLSDDVLYFIGSVDEHSMLTDVHLDIDTNLSILVDVLKVWRARKPNGCFSFIGSWFVYNQSPIPVTEQAPCSPLGFYSVAKLAAERLIESYCRVYNLPFRILRLANVYGGHDPGASRKKNALQWLIGKMARNEPIQLYYDGRFMRDYLHIDDAVRAIDVCLSDMPTDVTVNVGSGKSVEFRRIIEMARDALGSTSEITPWPGGAPDFHKTVQAKNFRMDVRFLRSYGWLPMVPLESGIKKMCWDLSHRV